MCISIFIIAHLQFSQHSMALNWSTTIPSSYGHTLIIVAFPDFSCTSMAFKMSETHCRTLFWHGSQTAWCIKSSLWAWFLHRSELMSARSQRCRATLQHQVSFIDVVYSLKLFENPCMVLLFCLSFSQGPVKAQSTIISFFFYCSEYFFSHPLGLFSSVTRCNSSFHSDLFLIIKYRGWTVRNYSGLYTGSSFPTNQYKIYWDEAVVFTYGLSISKFCYHGTDKMFIRKPKLSEEMEGNYFQYFSNVFCKETS